MRAIDKKQGSCRQNRTTGILGAQRLPCPPRKIADAIRRKTGYSGRRTLVAFESAWKTDIQTCCHHERLALSIEEMEAK